MRTQPTGPSYHQVWMIVIGIDCATDAKKVGIALADCDERGCALVAVELGESQGLLVAPQLREVVGTLERWEVAQAVASVHASRGVEGEALLHFELCSPLHV
jgi:hypothetical protein